MLDSFPLGCCHVTVTYPVYYIDHNRSGISLQLKIMQHKRVGTCMRQTQDFFHAFHNKVGINIVMVKATVSSTGLLQLWSVSKTEIT